MTRSTAASNASLLSKTNVNPAQFTAAIDPDFPRAIDQHVGDLRIAEQAFERAQAQHPVDDGAGKLRCSIGCGQPKSAFGLHRRRHRDASGPIRRRSGRPPVSITPTASPRLAPRPAAIAHGWATGPRAGCARSAGPSLGRTGPGPGGRTPPTTDLPDSRDDLRWRQQSGQQRANRNRRAGPDVRGDIAPPRPASWRRVSRSMGSPAATSTVPAEIMATPDRAGLNSCKAGPSSRRSASVRVGAHRPRVMSTMSAVPAAAPSPKCAEQR